MKPFTIAARWKDQIPATTAHLLELHVNHGAGVLSGFTLQLLSGDAFGAACSAHAEELHREGPQYGDADREEKSAAKELH